MRMSANAHVVCERVPSTCCRNGFISAAFDAFVYTKQKSKSKLVKFLTGFQARVQHKMTWVENRHAILRVDMKPLPFRILTFV